MHTCRLICKSQLVPGGDVLDQHLPLDRVCIFVLLFCFCIYLRNCLGTFCAILFNKPYLVQLIKVCVPYYLYRLLIPHSSPAYAELYL